MGQILMKGKHYNIITSFVSWKNIIIYQQYLLFSLTIYSLSYLLVLPRLHIYYLLPSLPNILIT
jgi:hypothetical protein